MRPRLSPPNSILPDRLDGGLTMANAQCLCGALKLMLREPSKLVVACHCLACQRRTGNPFSVGAFYAIDTVEILAGPRNLAIAVTGCAYIFAQRAARQSI